jgi:hypothetical protein
MVQQRHGDLDIGVPVTDRALVLDVVLDVVAVSAGAEVLAGASGQALAGVGAMGEASAGAELTLHWEGGSVMRCARRTTWPRSHTQ